MNNYRFTLNDFKKVFNFSIDYYLDPTKNTTGRTTGEPRGLGSILDSFILGKLTEIGVVEILKKENVNKEYILDFDIKSNADVKDEADIIEIKDKGTKREPYLFIEIKNTADNGRWIALTEEQFKTMKENADNREIFIIYASIESEIANNNQKSIDLLGMYLKNITVEKELFKSFADLNANLKIEFILSSTDFENFSYSFKKNMNMYETSFIKEKNRNTVYKKSGDYVKNLSLLEQNDYKIFNNIILNIDNNTIESDINISTFKIKGSFKIHLKGSKSIIECLSNVNIKNNIFGEFKLMKNKFYSFNLTTVGRDPQLKRNNLFIAKQRVIQLIHDKRISSVDKIVKDIANKI